MKRYRISKYNPLYRINGKYQKEEWTDYSDIGSNFNGYILTEDAYCATEKKYISCIMEILQNTGVSSLRIENLENYEQTVWKNQQYLSTVQFADIVRDCLRNKCWCRLINGECNVDFGYDYYVHLTINLPYEKVKIICKKYGLFCEVYNS